MKVLLAVDVPFALELDCLEICLRSILTGCIDIAICEGRADGLEVALHCFDSRTGDSYRVHGFAQPMRASEYVAAIRERGEKSSGLTMGDTKMTHNDHFQNVKRALGDAVSSYDWSEDLLSLNDISHSIHPSATRKNWRQLFVLTPFMTCSKGSEDHRGLLTSSNMKGISLKWVPIPSNEASSCATKGYDNNNTKKKQALDEGESYYLPSSISVIRMAGLRFGFQHVPPSVVVCPGTQDTGKSMHQRWLWGCDAKLLSNSNACDIELFALQPPWPSTTRKSATHTDRGSPSLLPELMIKGTLSRAPPSWCSSASPYLCALSPNKKESGKAGSREWGDMALIFSGCARDGNLIGVEILLPQTKSSSDEDPPPAVAAIKCILQPLTTHLAVLLVAEGGGGAFPLRKRKFLEKKTEKRRRHRRYQDAPSSLRLWQSLTVHEGSNTNNIIQNGWLSALGSSGCSSNSVRSSSSRYCRSSSSSSSSSSSNSSSNRKGTTTCDNNNVTGEERAEDEDSSFPLPLERLIVTAESDVTDGGRWAGMRQRIRQHDFKEEAEILPAVTKISSPSTRLTRKTHEQEQQHPHHLGDEQPLLQQQSGGGGGSSNNSSSQSNGYAGCDKNDSVKGSRSSGGISSSSSKQLALDMLNTYEKVLKKQAKFSLLYSALDRLSSADESTLRPADICELLTEANVLKDAHQMMEERTEDGKDRVHLFALQVVLRLEYTKWALKLSPPKKAKDPIHKSQMKTIKHCLFQLGLRQLQTQQALVTEIVRRYGKHLPKTIRKINKKFGDVDENSKNNDDKLLLGGGDDGEVRPADKSPNHHRRRECPPPPPPPSPPRQPHRKDSSSSSLSERTLPINSNHLNRNKSNSRKGLHLLQSKTQPSPLDEQQQAGTRGRDSWHMKNLPTTAGKKNRLTRARRSSSTSSSSSSGGGGGGGRKEDRKGGKLNGLTEKKKLWKSTKGKFKKPEGVSLAPHAMRTMGNVFQPQKFRVVVSLDSNTEVSDAAAFKAKNSFKNGSRSLSANQNNTATKKRQRLASMAKKTSLLPQNATSLKSAKRLLIPRSPASQPKKIRTFRTSPQVIKRRRGKIGSSVQIPESPLRTRNSQNSR